MEVKFTKLHPDAKTPTYSNNGDACMDLTAVELVYGEKWIEYKTGLSFEIPVGYVGLIFPRSSISNSDMFMANSVGVIDAGYRGEVTARFKHKNHPFRPKVYDVGDRVCQMMIIPRPEIKFIEVDELSDSERGTGGYGSTGK